MKIPIVEILILLFFLWPMIQKWLQKNQPGAQDDSDTIEYDPYTGEPLPPQNPSERAEWDEAMRELEMIFTGESPPEQSPKEGQNAQGRTTGDQSASKQSQTDPWKRDTQQESDVWIRNTRQESDVWNRDTRKESEVWSRDSRRSDMETWAGQARKPEVLIRRDDFSDNTPRRPRSFHEERLMKSRAAESRSTGAGRSADPEAAELVDALMASDNVIYQSLDKAVEIDDQVQAPSFSAFRDIKDPERLREFMVMKEILDKPRARRNAIENIV